MFTRGDGIVIEYVIVQEIEGNHGFPKGHVEGDETEIQTALREIWRGNRLREKNNVRKMIFAAGEIRRLKSIKNTNLFGFPCLYG